MHIDTVACAAEDQRCSHSLCEPACLVRNFLLVFPWKVDEMVVLGTNQYRNGCLVKPPSLAIPLLDAVECALSRQVEHEEDSNSIVANQRQHVDELALAAKIPNAECDFRVADADGLLHKVDTKGLDIVLIPAALDVFNHQTCLADLCVANHSNFDDHMVPPRVPVRPGIYMRAASPGNVVGRVVVGVTVAVVITAREARSRSR